MCKALSFMNFERYLTRKPAHGESAPSDCWPRSVSKSISIKRLEWNKVLRDMLQLTPSTKMLVPIVGRVSRQRK